MMTSGATNTPKPVFTVVICTRNRAALLGRALDSIRASKSPDVAWELLVVNNSSRDESEEIAKSFAQDLPIMITREERQGLSKARNAAIACALGQYIVWTDDDAIVGSNWLRAYAAAFARWPSAAFFGGAIFPLFEPQAPKWLIRGLPSVSTAYALREEPRGWTVIKAMKQKLPFGANMAVRADEQRRFLFCPELGRGSGRYSLGEETAVLHDILREGGFGIWVPGAEVRHVIGPERQTTRYLWAYYYAVGELKARAADGSSKKGARVWLKAISCVARYWLLRFLAPPEIWLVRLRRAAVAAGKLRSRCAFRLSSCLEETSAA